MVSVLLVVLFRPKGIRHYFLSKTKLKFVHSNGKLTFVVSNDTLENKYRIHKTDKQCFS